MPLSMKQELYYNAKINKPRPQSSLVFAKSWLK